ncbi:MAG: DEAD/DEAH box helicase [Parachlamydiaceae bacterium]|nr:DEAD/DEAH box helicase [Parachlamydiaceae bacterium]
MVSLPDFLKPFQTEAEQYLAQGLIREIAFSGPTYQLQIRDLKSKQEAWSFIQLDANGNIQDCFCTLEDGEELGACAHLAAAYLRIYNGHTQPLHQRFRNSLWNVLCETYAARLGDNPKLFSSVQPGHYTYASASGKVICFIKGVSDASKHRLEQIFERRRKETEETSLKFSNLSQEELTLWRTGRPSAELRYELSFWYDIAQWLMELQDANTPYEISFEHSANQLPNQITVDFGDLSIGFFLAESALPNIIPALATVTSPLTIHNSSYTDIDTVSFDAKKGVMTLSKQPTTTSVEKNESDISVNGWRYVPNKGFYLSTAQAVVDNEVISGATIGKTLTENRALLKLKLPQYKIHDNPITLSYTLSFDPLWNFHIDAYAFQPHDLQQSGAHDFGNWIFIPEQGFYPIEDPYFSTKNFQIPEQQVSDFISQERGWLNTQEGFATHLTNVETLLHYTMDTSNRLRFERLSDIKTWHETHDFGNWVYIAEQGFYAKVSTGTNLPINSDIAISAEQIPLFIRTNRADLRMVPNFFSERSPVLKAELHIVLGEDETIEVSPQFELNPQYKKEDVRFFDDYSYVPGEGFHELPIDARLPERFRHPMHVESDQIAYFLSKELPSLEHFTGHLDPQLIFPKRVVLSAENIERAPETDGTGYLLKLNYVTELGRVPLETIWAAIKAKKHFVFTQAGCFDLSDRRFDWVHALPKKRMDRRRNSLFVSTLELIRLHALEPLEIDSRDKQRAEKSAAVLTELTGFHYTRDPNLSGLYSTLRPYQELGVNWLWFLFSHGLSGLLCDEMGLGKTHQAMALLAAISNENKAQGNPPQHFLIVCPTSVIFHWQEKLQQFLPHLRVCTFHGSERSLASFHQDYDVLLTSYGIWRLEHKLLSSIPFTLAILDEIQIAKNHNSRLNISLRHIDAKMRLGLTGTPIENYLRELKSLFDLVLPTYMPSDADYRELFVRPIEREADPVRRELLSRFIKPFLMRRKKKDVLRDLPEKTEEISHCQLSPEQLMLYNQALLQSRQQLLEQLQDNTSSVPYIHIFALLSNLKQICDHPAVFLKDPTEYKNYASGKWDLFLELLNEARESQQKVVIFSQYLHMLDIIEEHLNEHEIGFATIRGSTTKRGEEITRFNNDPDCEVFLGSLNAAGLGVDLTAGSVVIHYDRWWNAARENQATDRVHRIGQTRGVQVFKLVTKGTFEERIDEMITRKGRLMEEVVTSDDHRFIKAFDRKELIQLLQEVEDYTDLQGDLRDS